MFPKTQESTIERWVCFQTFPSGEVGCSFKTVEVDICFPGNSGVLDGGITLVIRSINVHKHWWSNEAFLSVLSLLFHSPSAHFTPDIQFSPLCFSFILYQNFLS